MEQVAMLAAIALAVNKTVSVIKAIGKDNNTVITQLVVWVVGAVAIFLSANAEVAEALVIPGFTTTLGDMDPASLILIAWMLGGSGSFAYDVKKAIDGSDSASEPRLLGPSTTPTP